MAPSFDLVRIDPDGSAVIAGRVAPAASVTLMIDGAEVATVLPDGNGKFVAMFTLPASAAGRMLTMVAKMPDGTVMPSQSSVALAATAPVAVAAADAGTVTAEASTTATVAAPAQAATADAATADAATGGTTALAVTDQGVKVLQTGTEVPADVAANVVLQTIAYPSAAEVQFAGHGAVGGFVRLYLDNAALGAAVGVAADGSWSMTLSGIEPGLYTLRVDQLDAAGKVTSRFETPFKREAPEALAAASAAAVPAVAAAAAAAATTTADAGAATTTADAETAATTADAGAATTTADAAGTTAAATDAPATATATAIDTTAKVADAAPAAATSTTATDTAAAVATADAGTATAPETATADASAPAATTAEAAKSTAPATKAATATATTTAAATPKADAGAAATATTTADATAKADTAVAATTAVAPTPPPPVTITVQPGYTLWGIAKAHMGGGVMYVQVFDANRDKIRNPDLIYPGQVFTMPAAN